MSNLIPCKIERGGFDTERVFEIEVLDGGKLVGSAAVRHFLDLEKHMLGPDIPPFGEKVDGFVKCQVIRKSSDDKVLVELPSADVIHIPESELEPC